MNPVSLDALAEVVAGQLPEGWMIEVLVGNGYANLYLTNPQGDRSDLYQDETPLSEQFVEAVRRARASDDALLCDYCGHDCPSDEIRVHGDRMLCPSCYQFVSPTFPEA